MWKSTAHRGEVLGAREFRRIPKIQNKCFTSGWFGFTATELQSSWESLHVLETPSGADSKTFYLLYIKKRYRKMFLLKYVHKNMCSSNKLYCKYFPSCVFPTSHLNIKSRKMILKCISLFFEVLNMQI